MASGTRGGNTEQQSRLSYLTAVVQLVEIKSPSMPGCLKLLYAQRKTPTQTYRIKTAYNKLLKATQFPSRGVKCGASWNPRQWFKWTPKIGRATSELQSRFDLVCRLL